MWLSYVQSNLRTFHWSTHDQILKVPWEVGKMKQLHLTRAGIFMKILAWSYINWFKFNRVFPKSLRAQIFLSAQSTHVNWYYPLSSENPGSFLFSLVMSTDDCQGVHANLQTHLKSKSKISSFDFFQFSICS